jgi:signal peptide peptidase SppA
MNESILHSSFRAFLKTIFVLLGIGIGLIPLLLLIGTLSEGETLDQTNSITILPNADGSRASFSKTTPAILQLEITGTIGLLKLTPDKIRSQLQESHEGKMKDATVKGVLLRIKSPGGVAIDADSIYHAIQEYKAKYQVPVYAYVDGLCASGAMYIALAADKIYATNVSIIGSIGVIVNSFLNFAETIDKLGIKALTISAGKGKDDLNPLHPWKAGEGNSIKVIVDYFYNVFVDLVVENRPKVNRDELVNVMGANVFTAPTALEYGLIDKIENSYNSALSDLVKTAGLEGKPYQVVRLESKGWLQELFSLQTSSLFNGKIKHELPLSEEWQPDLMNKVLYLYIP